MKALKLLISVQAGIILGQPIPAYSKQWNMTKEEIADSQIRMAIEQQAIDYTKSIMDPGAVNWVTLNWIWI